MKSIKYIIIFCLTLFPILTFCQADIPNSPEIISVSVVPESNPCKFKIKWIPSDTENVTGNIIYIVKNSITETLTTIAGNTITEAEVVFPDEYTKPEKIRMAAIDDMQNKSKITEPHTTIFLRTENEKCEKRIKLFWTPYEAWANDIRVYNIYRRTLTSAYELLVSVPGFVYEYQDEDITFNDEYTYYIEALNYYDNTASSNASTKGLDSFVDPEYIYIEYVSVINENIEIKFIADPNAEIRDYYVQRSDNRNGPFKNIKTIPNQNQISIVHIDTDVNPNESTYYYRIAAINPCDYAVNYSNVSSNIFLKSKTSSELEHELDWTEYETWLGETLNYKAFYLPENNNGIEIASILPAYKQYTHNIEQQVASSQVEKILITNKFCYYIEAYEDASGNNLNVSGISRSNVSCVYEKPIIWVPNIINIFSEQEINREFKPVISFVGRDNYEFKIYDRWGQIIFETRDPAQGWKGKLPDGNIAPSQVYIYRIKFYDFDNNEIIKSGTFLMDIN